MTGKCSPTELPPTWQMVLRPELASEQVFVCDLVTSWILGVRAASCILTLRFRLNYSTCYSLPRKGLPSDPLMPFSGPSCPPTLRHPSGPPRGPYDL